MVNPEFAVVIHWSPAEVPGTTRDRENWGLSQWEFQDPKMEVCLYHISGDILWGYSLKIRLQK